MILFYVNFPMPSKTVSSLEDNQRLRVLNDTRLSPSEVHFLQLRKTIFSSFSSINHHHHRRRPSMGKIFGNFVMRQIQLDYSIIDGLLQISARSACAVEEMNWNTFAMRKRNFLPTATFERGV